MNAPWQAGGTLFYDPKFRSCNIAGLRGSHVFALGVSMCRQVKKLINKETTLAAAVQGVAVDTAICCPCGSTRFFCSLDIGSWVPKA